MHDPISEQTEDEFVIHLFKDTVYSLSISPGYFDNVMDNLMETMLMFISKTETMEAIACTIIEQVSSNDTFDCPIYADPICFPCIILDMSYRSSLGVVMDTNTTLRGFMPLSSLKKQGLVSDESVLNYLEERPW